MSIWSSGKTKSRRTKKARPVTPSTVQTAVPCSGGLNDLTDTDDLLCVTKREFGDGKPAEANFARSAVAQSIGALADGVSGNGIPDYAFNFSESLMDSIAVNPGEDSGGRWFRTVARPLVSYLRPRGASRPRGSCIAWP